MHSRRWLFADQLGSHFLDSPDQPALLIESKAVFRRRRYHRQKAHLILSALRHRAAELGDRAVLVRGETYGAALDDLGESLTVCHPTSMAALRFVQNRPDVTVLPARGFASTAEEFAAFARGRRRLLMEDFYRDARRRLGVLVAGDEPVGGRWNYDHDNREGPPRGAATLGVAPPYRPAEDEIDAEVRADLDAWEAAGEVAFVGRDGPRLFAVTEGEARAALEHFVRHRLAAFGPHEDAMLAGDATMSHSLLSVPLNLGLLDPIEVAHAAEDAYRSGAAPLASVEGFVRQVIGWRDYMWHTYWHFGPEHRASNALAAHEPVPDWLWELDADAVTARCLRTVLAQVRDTGWTHHIPRLMVLGNWALQRGIDPAQVAAWFHLSFVDGYDWVMASNVIGMSQHADGGRTTTKPYAAGGAYINRMSDFCRPCAYRPTHRTGEYACPFTAGYWEFLARNSERLAANPRMRQPLQGLRRLADLEELRTEVRRAGTSPP
ncbi:MAG: cryptochrome/photolyase family protein [Sporichthyaceae bacterium]